MRAVRHPPGRAGRPWLSHRLEVARRGAEVLDEKRRALIRERLRLEPEVVETCRAWEAGAREAETWLQRAAVIGGERQLAAARAATSEPAEIEVAWRGVLGTICPSQVRVSAGGARARRELGGSAALPCAAEAHERALEAAARYAAARTALERVEGELERTRQRASAIEHRWIPGHESALAELDLTLEELEREDGTRVRWVKRRR